MVFHRDSKTAFILNGKNPKKLICFCKNSISKNVFDKKSRIMPKNPKRDPLGSLNLFFTNLKLQKKSRGYLLIDFRNFRKKVPYCRKTSKEGTLVLPSSFRSFKKLCFSAKIEPTLSCFSDPKKLVGQEVEQMVKKVDHSE